MSTIQHHVDTIWVPSVTLVSLLGSPSFLALAGYIFCKSLFTLLLQDSKTKLIIRDAFRKYATEIFILQMMTKNLLFFMFSKFINAWEVNAGAGYIFEVFGIISMVLLVTSIPMCRFSLLYLRFVLHVSRLILLP
jgi:hypothetical protein